VQNAHVESFHGKLRDECLNVSWFGNLFEARAKIATCREEYNEYLAPREFARRTNRERSHVKVQGWTYYVDSRCGAPNTIAENKPLPQST